MATTARPLRCYLVEWYRSERAEETLDKLTATLDECAAVVSADGPQVRLVGMIDVPADEVLFGVFAATSANLVTETCRLASIPAHRLSDAVGACSPESRSRETPDESPIPNEIPSFRTGSRSL